MMNKQGKRARRDDLATITARIHGVTDGYVRRVIKGERTNERIFETYMSLKEGKTNLIHTIEKTVRDEKN